VGKAPLEFSTAHRQVTFLQANAVTEGTITIDAPDASSKEKLKITDSNQIAELYTFQAGWAIAEQRKPPELPSSLA